MATCMDPCELFDRWGNAPVCVSCRQGELRLAQGCVVLPDRLLGKRRRGKRNPKQREKGGWQQTLARPGFPRLPQSCGCATGHGRAAFGLILHNSSARVGRDVLDSVSCVGWGLLNEELLCFIMQALQVQGLDDASLSKEFGGVFSAETAHDDRQTRRVRHRPAGRVEEVHGPKMDGGLYTGRRVHRGRPGLPARFFGDVQQ